MSYLQNIVASEGNMRLIGADTSDETLYVVFGSLGAGPGRYTFFRTFLDLKKHTLFINSPKDNWFSEPISWLEGSGLQNSVDRLAQIVNEICEEKGLRKVVLLGFSMGAYGAMLYSSSSQFAVPVEIIAFGPKSRLDIPKSITVKYQQSISYTHGGGSLVDGLFFIPLHKYHIIFGELDIADAYSALNIREAFPLANIKISSHAGSTHNVAATFKAQSGLLYAIQSVLQFKFDLPGTGALADFLCSEDVRPLLNFSVNMNNQEECEYLEKLVDKYPRYALALNRIGSFHHNRGKLELAFNYLMRSWVIAPSHSNTNIHLSLVYEKLGNSEASLTHALLAKSQSPTSHNAARVLKLSKRIIEPTIETN